MTEEGPTAPDIDLPDDLDAHVADVFQLESGQPAMVEPYLPGHTPGHHGGRISGTRTADHRGRQIEIRTTYEITVDGEPFLGHVEVGHDGRLHCHSIPYEDYSSAVDFVRRLIDFYPASFPSGGGPATAKAKTGHQRGGHDHG